MVSASFFSIESITSSPVDVKRLPRISKVVESASAAALVDEAKPRRVVALVVIGATSTAEIVAGGR